MEVTTVSPSPSSPTEGDDLCETDVSNVAIHSVTLLICLCGLFGNWAVLCFTSLKDRNADFFYLALIDFIFLLFTVHSTLLFLVEDVSCSSIMPLLYFSFLFQLSSISYYWVLFRLMPFSSVGKIFKLLCHCCLPKCLLWLVYGVQYWAFFALFTVIPAVRNRCPSHQQQHCQAALISMYLIILLLWVAPMLISRKIGFIRVKWVSKKQQPERREIIISLIVLFTLLLSLYNFLPHDVSYIVVSSHVVFLVNCIHSSIKPFMYFLAGRCWRPCTLSSLRLSLQRVFDEQKEKIACRRKKLAPKDTRV